MRHAQSDEKQQVSVDLGIKLIKMNLEIDFLHVARHTQIYLFDAVHEHFKSNSRH